MKTTYDPAVRDQIRERMSPHRRSRPEAKPGERG
jgi:hypothetical protein